MPELPEVETIKNSLQSILDTQITSIELNRQDILRRSDYAPEEIYQTAISQVQRRGKYLLISFANDCHIVFHMGMSGRLYLLAEEDIVLEPHVHVIIHLDDGRKLLYQDARRFGGVWLLQDAQSFFTRLGKEPLSEEFSAKYLTRILKGRKTAVKNVLLNQKLICGLGNIYVDEALFAAKIKPDRRADSLSTREIHRLCREIKEVLQNSIAYRGTTFRDFRDGYKQPGEFQNHLQVYGRNNKPCPSCGKLLQKTIIGGRSSHFCEKCQK